MAESEIISAEFTPNFFYRDGTLWIPTRNSETGEIKPPLMNRAELGSMMPVVELSIPGIFESKIVPYENIVSFEVTGGIKEGTLTASLVLVDSTPIFIEEVIRRWLADKHNATASVDSTDLFGQISQDAAKNDRTGRLKNLYDEDPNANANAIRIRWGWKIQNIPNKVNETAGKGLKDFSEVQSNHGILTDWHEFDITFAGYKYSAYGVIVTITMTDMGTALMKASNMLIAGTDAALQSISSLKLPVVESTLGDAPSIGRSLESVVSSIINQAVKNTGREFRVVILDDGISFDKLTDLKVNPRETSVNAFLDSLCAVLYLPAKSKEAPSGGIVKKYVSERSIVINGKPVYPIYIYNPERITSGSFQIPTLAYPANETPILGWNPTVESANENAFLNTTRYTTVDAKGNQTTQEALANAITAGNPLTPVTSSSSLPAQGANKNILGKAKKARIVANIDVDILGDPMFTSLNAINQRWDVVNAGIVQEGIVRDSSDFFRNFNGLDPSFRSAPPKGFPSVSLADAAAESPFNGSYILTGYSHKINKQMGYQTSLTLSWYAGQFTSIGGVGLV